MERVLEFIKAHQNSKSIDEYKKAFNALNPLEKERHILELDNLKMSNNKLKNEWKHLIIAGVIGSILTLATSLTIQLITGKDSPQEILKNNDTIFVKESIHTNQKDTLKTK